MKTTTEVNFTKVTEQQQGAAKDIILEGFKEYFGFIDHTMNPDLNNIYRHYNMNGNAFYVGEIEDWIICTGAITKESESTARIERMSVKKEYRRQGIAQKMLFHLEKQAGKMGYSKIVMETNKEWPSAINLYNTNGYTPFKRDSQRIHMLKEL
ncbi:GNAT family N-acetyltransferase [Virgibacillus salinus]|uniref:Acetyltransferase (GNAT) domain-containing protein n=1 Tax=Virgibacillus salinus TaxID=553311 RepID=A0A1H1DM75_9BACI|nr:GNAT family N-acetyltransferase [Virgibacillus salinus]SDQ77557.1 Acetyltransferase (GNAT) domain-containing protein [Virgibacillus salinus]